jgi:hypothetical protein
VFGQRNMSDGKTEKDKLEKDITKDLSFVPDTMDFVVPHKVGVKRQDGDATCRSKCYYIEKFLLVVA